MVIPTAQHASPRGALLIELLVAIALLMGAVLPLAYSIASEKRFAQGAYQRAVAMELVDGEVEILANGAWTNFPAGTHVYPVKAAALTNLPPGQFTLTIAQQTVRLEWKPAIKRHGGSVVREFKLP